MLRNRRGATSLRWLRALLDAGIEVHGQIVVCPGVNDGPVLEDTLAGVLERYPELATAAAVPLGVSRFSHEATMRPHTIEEAVAVVELVERWQDRFSEGLGRRLVYAADEYYLLARRAFPSADTYEGFARRRTASGWLGTSRRSLSASAPPPGWAGRLLPVGRRCPASGYRAARATTASQATSALPISILTGRYGERVLRPLLADRPDVEVIGVENQYFGGNIAVTGLMTGAGPVEGARRATSGRRYLLPTSASPRVASSTASGQVSCPIPWRSSRRVATRCDAPRTDVTIASETVDRAGHHVSSSIDPLLGVDEESTQPEGSEAPSVEE